MIRAALAIVAVAVVVGVAQAKPRFAPIPEVDIAIPSGWNLQANPDGPLTIGPGTDDKQGVLQFSKLPIVAVEKAQQQGLLPFAQSMAKNIGWDKVVSTREGPCALGRYAFIATTGEFKVQLLWMTKTPSAIYLWTWIHSSDAPDRVAIAENTVRTAKLRKP